jgi:hypothetical protein
VGDATLWMILLTRAWAEKDDANDDDIIPSSSWRRALRIASGRARQGPKRAARSDCKSLYLLL